MSACPTWISRIDEAGEGWRLAVKDAIDVAGSVTTLGSTRVADGRSPAGQDAACVASLRAAGGRVVGKANLHAFCFGTTGVNPDFGTPVNPRWPHLVPGGSSSGSAVAVASSEVDLALGTDTTGSVRIPAACCGVVGLKLTNGATATGGVWTLSANLDAIGLLARDVGDLALGVRGLGLSTDGPGARRIARLRVLGVEPAVEQAVDLAFEAAGVIPERVGHLDWVGAARATEYLVATDALASIGALFDGRGIECAIDARARLERGARIDPARRKWALEVQARWQEQVRRVLDRFDVIAMPTLVGAPPAVRGPFRPLNRMTGPVNLAGLPAVAVPLSGSSLAPVSLQLVGRDHAEGALLTTAATFQGVLDRGR